MRSELEPRHPVSPWLAGLYVVPQHRRHGIGRALVAAIEDQARLRGNRPLYLYTDSAIKCYERLGWNAIDQIEWKGFPKPFTDSEYLAASITDLLHPEQLTRGV